MKTTLTTKANQLDGRLAQPGRASRFASAPTCSLSQVVGVVSNYISVIDDQLEFLSFSLSGTLDGAGGVGGLLAAYISSNNNRSDLPDFPDIRDLQDLQTSADRSAGGGVWYFPLYDYNGFLC